MNCQFCKPPAPPVFKDEMCESCYARWLETGAPVPTLSSKNKFRGNGHIKCELCGDPVRDHAVGPRCQGRRSIT